MEAPLASHGGRRVRVRAPAAGQRTRDDTSRPRGLFRSTRACAGEGRARTRTTASVLEGGVSPARA